MARFRVMVDGKRLAENQVGKFMKSWNDLVTATPVTVADPSAAAAKLVKGFDKIVADLGATVKAATTIATTTQAPAPAPTTTTTTTAAPAAR